MKFNEILSVKSGIFYKFVSILSDSNHQEFFIVRFQSNLKQNEQENHKSEKDTVVACFATGDIMEGFTCRSYSG